MKTQNTAWAKSRARRRWVLAAALGVMTPMAVALPSANAADEFGSNTPYYEDDAWYDITEWFDGNDYNPTDEAIFRWDDETYDTSDALTSSDTDNDINWSESRYGYSAYDGSSDDDWFYDYYDDGYADYNDYNDDETWDYTANYYDYDYDGVYDAVAEYVDTDHDGIYENYNYISFADSNPEQDKQNKMKSQNDQKSMSSKVVSRRGSIKSVKKVETPHGKNLVVMFADDQKGENTIVDLGAADQFDASPSEGSDISVEGAMFKAGEKNVLLARKATLDGKQRTINRSGREFTGTVEDKKTMKVRGNTHQLAKIKTDNGKKLLVDMGPQDNLELDLKKGSKLTVSGPAVKVKDRLMLIAREVSMDGKSTDIERVALKL